MNKHIISLLLALTLLFTLAVPAFATEATFLDEEISEEIGIAEEPAKAQPTISIRLEVPEGFNIDVDATIVARTSGNKVEIPLKSPEYSNSAKVDEGYYRIESVVVENRDDLGFDFSTEDFYVGNSGYKTVITMKNIENVIRNANKKWVDTTKAKTDDVSITGLYDSPHKEVSFDNAYKPYYLIRHKGAGGGAVSVYGYPADEYNIALKVTKGGVLSEAEFISSYNWGYTWGKKATVIESSLSDEVTGLTYNFELSEGSEFREGDIFFFHTLKMYPVTTSVSQENGQLIVTAAPQKDHSLNVEVIKTGSLTEMKVKVSDSTKNLKLNEDGIYSPDKDGNIKLDDDITLCFKDTGKYTVGDSFTTSMKGEAVEKKSNAPFFIIIGVVAVLVIGGVIFLISKKDKPSSYVIKKYLPHKAKQENAEDEYFDDEQDDSFGVEEQK